MKRKTTDEASICLSLKSSDEDQINRGLIQIYAGIRREIDSLIREWGPRYRKEEVSEIHKRVLSALLSKHVELAETDDVLSAALEIAFWAIYHACDVIDARQASPALQGSLYPPSFTSPTATDTPTS